MLTLVNFSLIHENEDRIGYILSSLNEILTQKCSPGSFPGLGGSGLDFLILGLLRFCIKSSLRLALPPYFQAWAPQGWISSFPGLLSFFVESLVRTALPAHVRAWASDSSSNPS